MLYEPTLSDIKLEISRIFKEIEDAAKSDSYLIERLKSLMINDEAKQILRDAKDGVDELNILHHAAKYCRILLCLSLTQDFKLDKSSLTKSRQNLLHILVKNNVIPKCKGQEEAHFSQKKTEFDAAFKIFSERGESNAQDENGSTPLHYAAQKNNYEAAYQLLITPGININIEDTKNMTPLDVACRHGSDDELAFLLVQVTDIERLTNRQTLIYLCKSKEEKYGVFKVIMEKIKRESTSDKKYLDIITKKPLILHTAAEHNHLKIVESLFRDYEVDQDLKDNKTGNLIIHLAAKQNSIDLFNLLVNYNAVSFKTNSNLDNALHIASQNNCSRFIRCLLEYEKMLEEKSENDAYIPCMCRCDVICTCETSNTSSIEQLNKKNYDPLMMAIASRNHKCVEELILASEAYNRKINIHLRDKLGNTCLHLCAQSNNVDSLNYLLNKYFSKETSILKAKNLQDETVLHVACRYGNLEIIKIILNRIYESDLPNESILMAQNKDGETCFAIACAKGYLNVVEYFLKDKKLKLFLELVDNNSNTCLHVATFNGHFSIASLLLDNGINVTAVNEKNLSALDISCRKGFFEISKILISYYATMDECDSPLQTACYEGAHEVVSLLLQKGAAIDSTNESGKNCLDIAISRDQKDVIITLLQDKNWHKLIKVTNEIPKNLAKENDLIIKASTSSSDTKAQKHSFRRERKLIENPQLSAMYEKKSWDCFKLILDKCISKEEIDFSKIDPEFKSISHHPLMFIALSGQESLLKHEVTRVLLDKKWRLIPRFVYYFNLLFYLTFLSLLSVYSLELASYGKNGNANNTNQSLTNMTNTFKYKLSFDGDLRMVSMLLFIILMLNLIKEIAFLFYDGLSYLTKTQNVVEFITYGMSMVSLLSNDVRIKSDYGSLAIVFAFILFPLYMQKLKLIGIYVVAFLRTLTNSAKFFPVFLIIYIGFIFGFKIRSNFGVTYFNSTSFSMIRTITMVVGEFDSSKMGLYEDSIPNFIIYVLFITLMCIILINLFVGIAVGEIKTVLDEADIQQISMRIMFVLKVQSALNPLQRFEFCKRFLNMSFEKHKRRQQNKLVKLVEKVKRVLKKTFISEEPKINLSDPQKRLEDSFMDMSRNTKEEIKSIKSLFNIQISDVETKLVNSQVRVEDTLKETTRKTIDSMDMLAQGVSNSYNKIHNKLGENEHTIEKAILNLGTKTSDEMNYFRVILNEKMFNLENKLILSVENSFRKFDKYLNSMNSNLDVQSSEMRKNFETSNKSSKQIKNDLDTLKTNSFSKIEEKIERFVLEIKELRENISKINQSLNK